jgi:AhpD family alkylhydroperoxidase
MKETSHGGYLHLLSDLRPPTKSLRRAVPEMWTAFVGTHDAAMAQGEVPTRSKEAVALAISVVKRCDGCIAYHAKAAARAGATPAEACSPDELIASRSTGI